MTAVTVVIPAHNEEALIEGTVHRLLSSPSSDLAVLVVANGCSDRTVARARAADSRVRVVEVDRASKIAALNAASDHMERYPVAYVDADVIVDGATLLELARRMENTPSALVGAPRMRVAPSRSWWVRQYYRVWELTDYRSAGHVGSGIYMLSKAGRGRFGEFPDLIADDRFVQQLFGPEERLTPEDLTFTVRAPATLSALAGRNARIAAGNMQLTRERPDLAGAQPGVGARALVRRVWRRPGLWVGFVVYSTVYLRAQRRASRLLREPAPVSWSRDETTRTVSG